jgi:hypothetical protein
MPELLLGEARVDRRQAAAAIFGRDVHRIEPERLRLLEDRARLFGIERALLLQRLLERHQLAAHEASRRLDQEPLFVAEREIHVSP